MRTLTMHLGRPSLERAPTAHVTKRHASRMLIAALAVSAASAAVFVAVQTRTGSETGTNTPAVAPPDLTGLDGVFNGVGVNTPTAVQLPDLTGLDGVFNGIGVKVPAEAH